MKLLTQRRFFPFFIVQFFGAFNDNLYKNALLVLLALELSSSSVLSFYTNLSMALFILPMFIFSAWSGLLAERIEKRRLIIIIKWLEVIIMIIGISAFLLHNYELMIVVLSLLGLQSAFFGPAKYGFLPERLSYSELMAGNGLVEAATFLSILFGTLMGSYLIGLKSMRWILYAVMISAALLGLLFAYFIPEKAIPTNRSGLPEFKPWRQTKTLLSYTYKQHTVFQSILAISWFWLLGGALLTQLPQFGKEIAGGDQTVITYLLVLFSVGVGLGSLASNLLSKGRIEAGLVPFGAFIMAYFLWLVIKIPVMQTDMNTLRGFSEFWHDPHFWQVSIAFSGLAFAGGIYIVPLYALIQHYSPNGYKAQMIAANNIINSLFLVLISVITIFILSILKWTLQEFFIVLLICHIVVSVYIFTVVPEFIFRLIVIILTTFIYRIRVIGKHHMPKEGAAIFVCNHISYMDALIILAKSRRPVRFIMYYKIFSVPVLSWLFKTANAIPIASRREDDKIYQDAILQVREALQNGEIVGIFPEGKITSDGEIDVFKSGVEIMLKNDPVPVIPMALENLWGSFFSRKNGLFKGWPRKWMSLITLNIGEALPADTKAAEMRMVVNKLKSEAQRLRIQVDK